MQSPPIIGHHFQREMLLRDLEAKNVAHAYLFAGPRNLGKFTIAKWFSRLLLLADARQEGEERELQRQIEQLLHPDLLVLDGLWMEGISEDLHALAKTSNLPQQHRVKSRAKTDTISIDDIRTLQQRLMEVGIGTYRCCLIRSAERMQEEAVTALLKILEEPPAGVVFLLTTESLSTLPSTLISRTRLLHFSRLSPRELHPLVEDAPADDARFLLHVSQGAPGLLRSLQRNPDLLRRERLLHAEARAFWEASSLTERLRSLRPLEERAREAESMLFHLCLSLREKMEEAPSSREMWRLLRWNRALQSCIQGLHTNAVRPLLIQRFALEAEEE